MPRKNFYISDADEKEVYQKAKALAGDSISAVIVDALKQYVYSREAAAKEMGQIVIFIGQDDHNFDVTTGTNMRFTGKELSNCKQDLGKVEMFYRLYYTLKGKFLVWSCELDTSTNIEKCYHKVYDSFREVSEKGYPSELIMAAVSQMPDVACEELDV